MAINDIKKINVRSPYFIEVVDKYYGLTPPETPDPDPDTIINPVSTIEPLECGNVIYYGVTLGTKKFRIDTLNKQYGGYTFNIAGIFTPVKWRIYTEGVTPPPFQTIGLDNYQQLWFDATGESPSLASKAAYPNGFSINTTYTTASATAAVSQYVIVEILMPMPIEGMNITLTSCPDEVVAIDPIDIPVSTIDALTTSYVTVLTVQMIGSLSRGTGNSTTGVADDVTITLNGTRYLLSNHRRDSGIRLVFSNAQPNFVVLNNNFPYIANPSTTSGLTGDGEWTYDYGLLYGQLPITFVDESAINTGMNELILSTNGSPFGNSGGTGASNFKADIHITSHPVYQENNVNIIRTLGDGGASWNRSYYRGITDQPHGENAYKHTINFTGGNTKNITKGSTNQMITTSPSFGGTFVDTVEDKIWTNVVV